MREIVPGPLSGILHPSLPTRVVRVAIQRNASQVELSTRGPCVLFDSVAGRRIDRFAVLRPTRITVTPQGMLLRDGMPLNTTKILLYPDIPATLYVGDICYRGKIEIVGAPGGTMTVINVLPLEDYLLGVVPRETYPSWPDAALQAQAIAARSFAVHHLIHSTNRDYPLIAPLHQVYGGASAEHPRTTQAVRDTEGQVMLYRGDVLIAFFHANCGGVTEDAQNLFPNVTAFPPRTTSRFTVGTPHHAWTYSVAGASVVEKLRQSGRAFNGPLTAVDVERRFPSGRAAAIRFSSAQNNVVLTGEETRRLLGYNHLRSTLFNIRLRGGNVYFWGRGWGHGVGLCQWSSKSMAEQGYSAQQILLHFYPGATIHRL